MFTRQPRQVPITSCDKSYIIIGSIFLVGQFLYLGIELPRLPDEVPAHYNLEGEVDRMGSKYETLILPIINLFSSTLILVLSRYPHKFNYVGDINDRNCHHFYHVGRQLLYYVFALEAVLFFGIVVGEVQLALGNLPIWGFLVLVFSLVFTLVAGIIIYILRMKNLCTGSRVSQQFYIPGPL